MPRPPEMATPPTTTAAMTFISRPGAGAGLHVDELDGGEHGGQAGERPHEHEGREDHAARMDADEARGLRVGAGGIDRPAGGEPAQAPRESREDDERRDHDGHAAAGLAEAEPLEPRRQVLDPDAFRPPAQAFAQDDHRGQRHHDGGQPEPATSAPLIAPSAAPAATTPMVTSGMGSPVLASRPAATPQIANCDPMEMSI